jgi:hypothetical protein
MSVAASFQSSGACLTQGRRDFVFTAKVAREREGERFFSYGWARIARIEMVGVRFCPANSQGADANWRWR